MNLFIRQNIYEIGMASSTRSVNCCAHQATSNPNLFFRRSLLAIFMEIQTTNGITVSVETQYLPTHSNPRERKYIFGYRISIENGTDTAVQLTHRHWIIWDADGQFREVEGEGVVGLQPVIEPGQCHTYASFCNLHAEIGSMKGSYRMVRLLDTHIFDVVIPTFKMVVPFKMN